jgi:hypothetical protein
MESFPAEHLISRPQTQAELCRVIEEAFHFRGDVALHLHSGECVQGYLFNRNMDEESPHLQMYIEGHTAPRRVLYSEVVAIHFSGEDTASGKDWEAWVKKKESERQAEALRVEAAARARGHL